MCDITLSTDGMKMKLGKVDLPFQKNLSHDKTTLRVAIGKSRILKNDEKRKFCLNVFVCMGKISNRSVLYFSF